MNYNEFCKKINDILSIKIDTDDIDLKKALNNVIEKEINKVLNDYYYE